MANFTTREKSVTPDPVGLTLAPAQRVAEWANVFRQWLGVRRGVGIEQPTQRVTAREHMVLRPEAVRQSRGMRM